MNIKMSKQRLMQLIDILVDDRINMFGLKNTIDYLLDEGYTKEELVDDLMFDATDVEPELFNRESGYES